jgi:hypothetical protein
MRRKGV